MGEIGDPARPGGRAFVGRDREVAELAVALEDAAGGRGCLLLVAGEPGIGKTWLAEHLAARSLKAAMTRPWPHTWVRGRPPSPKWSPASPSALGQPRSLLPARLSPMLRVYLFKAITGFFLEASAVQRMLLFFHDRHGAEDAGR